MQTNEIEDRGTSYIDKNEATDQESEDDAGLDYEDTSRKSMYSTADIHKSGTISNNRVGKFLCTSFSSSRFSYVFMLVHEVNFFIDLSFVNCWITSLAI